MRYLLFLLTAAALWSCKPTEANYRAAYEKAVAGRDSTRSIESTIYGRHRALGMREMVSGGDTIPILVQPVLVTDGGGGIRESLKPYSVVVAQFKQQFNAVSMRDCLADAGYPGAFVVQNGEPFYYVVLSSWRTQAEAVEAKRNIPAGFPVAMKAPCPFILNNSR